MLYIFGRFARVMHKIGEDARLNAGAFGRAALGSRSYTYKMGVARMKTVRVGLTPYLILG